MLYTKILSNAIQTAYTSKKHNIVFTFLGGDIIGYYSRLNRKGFSTHGKLNLKDVIEMGWEKTINKVYDITLSSYDKEHPKIMH